MLKVIGLILMAGALVWMGSGIWPLYSKPRPIGQAVHVTGLKHVSERGRDKWQMEYTDGTGKHTITTEGAQPPAPLNAADVPQPALGERVEIDVRAFVQIGNVILKVPDYPFINYLKILWLLPVFALGMAFLIMQDPMAERKCDIPAPRVGMFELKPLFPPYQRRILWGVLAVVWSGVAWPVGWDYLANGSPDNRAGGVMLTIVFMAAGLGALALAIYYFRADGRIKTYRIALDTLPMSVGREVTVQSFQDFARKCKLAQVRIGLVCLKIQGGKGTGIMSVLRARADAYAQQWKDVLINRAVDKGQHINLSHVFHVPLEAVPSTPMSQKKFPIYAWQVQLHMTFVDGPDYWVKFPVVVDLQVAQTTVKRKV